MRDERSVGLAKAAVERRLASASARAGAQAGDSAQLGGALADFGALARRRAEADAVVAVLVIACNRPEATEAHLRRLVELRPSTAQFPIVVSQDCAHEPTAGVIRRFVRREANISLVQQPDQSDITVPKPMEKYVNYYKISRHYKFALNHVFTELGHTAVIVTEEDLELGGDFFSYFRALLGVLRADASLWCVSAWNDNGKAGLVDSGSPALLHRTDFFPGLGWMLLAGVWAELGPKWPAAFWDDWMREPAQRRGRACIRPELSRTAISPHGKAGVSKGLWYEQHLRFIRLSPSSVDFEALDLSGLHQGPYDASFSAAVYGAPLMSLAQASANISSSGWAAVLRVEFASPAEFHAAAKQFGLMNDLRSGVSRTGYKGVVSFFVRGVRVFLAPPKESWRGYDPKWN